MLSLFKKEIWSDSFENKLWNFFIEINIDITWLFASNKRSIGSSLFGLYNKIEFSFSTLKIYEPWLNKNLEDPFKQQRLEILKEYHPYTDGNSAKRMVDAVEEYIKKNGVPEKRLISWFRRYKINKIFSKIWWQKRF